MAIDYQGCKSAFMLVFHNDKILLVHDKNVGYWMHPGGRIDEYGIKIPYDKSVFGAAKREFFE